MTDPRFKPGIAYSLIKSREDGKYTRFEYLFDIQRKYQHPYKILESIESMDSKAIEKLEWKAADSRTIYYQDTKGIRQHGDYIYCIVRAVNASGLISYGISGAVGINETAPYIADVWLMNNPISKNYINSHKNLKAAVEAYTDITGETVKQYSVSYGTMDPFLNYTAAENSHFKANPGTLSVIPMPLSKEALSEEEIYYLKASAVNNTDQESWGYSQGFQLDTSVPTVYGATARFIGGEFLFSWSIDVKKAPLHEVECALHKADDAGFSRTFKPENNQLKINIAKYNAENKGDITDGQYYLTIRAQNKAGTFSKETETNRITYDTTGPVIKSFDVTSLDWVDGPELYTADKVTIKIKATDALSSIAYYDYMIEPVEPGADFFTRGWKSIENKKDDILISHSLKPGASLNKIQGTGLIMKIRAIDTAGNSSRMLSSKPIIIDTTPPGVGEVMIPKYSNKRRDVLTQFSVSEDLCREYRLAAWVIKKDRFGSKDPDIQNIEYRNTNAFDITAHYGKESDEMLENSEYQVAYHLINRAGLSVTGVTPGTVTIDRTDPKISFAPHPDQPGKWIDVDNDDPKLSRIADHFVFNQNIMPLKYEFSNTVSPDSLVIKSVTNGSNENVLKENYSNLNSILTISNEPHDTYRVDYELKDEAGNKTEDMVFLRYNKPPEFGFSDMTTTPGKPQSLGTYELRDPDSCYAVDHFTFQWYLYDNESDSSGQNKARTLGAYDREYLARQNPEVRFLHAEDSASKTIWKMTLEVTDQDGGTSRDVYDLKVVNTTVGRLHYPETWSGRHDIKGDIFWNHLAADNITPIKLSIAPDTLVIIKDDPTDEISGYEIRVTNEILINQGVSIRCAQDSEKWGGLIINKNAKANLTGTQSRVITLKNAHRALVLSPGSKTKLVHTVFDRNFIGLHVLSTEFENINIQSCEFNNHDYLGIKEEFEPDPNPGGPMDLGNSRFSGNYMDYYDSEKSKINLDQKGK